MRGEACQNYGNTAIGIDPNRRAGLANDEVKQMANHLRPVFNLLGVKFDFSASKRPLLLADFTNIF